MSVDWRKLSNADDLRVSENTVEVLFHDQRRQVIQVDEATDASSLRLWSIVARPSALAELREPGVDAWRRNRFSEFVGFSVDRRGRMIGETWVPTGSLTADEWVFLVRNLAAACDRFEYLLTGRDEA